MKSSFTVFKKIAKCISAIFMGAAYLILSIPLIIWMTIMAFGSVTFNFVSGLITKVLNEISKMRHKEYWIMEIPPESDLMD